MLGSFNRYAYDPQGLPPDAIIREIKYCENCMNAFVRAMCRCKLDAIMKGEKIDFAEFRCGCPKYCNGCVGRMLLPLDLEDYEAMLPRAVEQKQSHHLPKYDNSLLPKELHRVYTRQPATPHERRVRRHYGDWRERLRVAFEAKGVLSSLEIQEVIGVSGAPNCGPQLCHTAKFPILRVGFLPREEGIKNGRGIALYKMRTQEELQGSKNVEEFIRRLEISERVQ